MRKTKIIATIGPASTDKKILTAMIQAGLNVARLNFSHGSFEEHEERVINIRSLEKKLKTRIKIFQDLGGPKLRLGEFKDFYANENDKIIFGQGGIPVQKEIWKWIKKDQPILIDDGIVELITTKITKDGLEAKVVVPGMIKMKKGVSLPGIKVDLPALSGKDMSDVEFAVENKLDAVALSFVKTVEDITSLRKAIKKYSQKEIPIIAKIETLEALENIRQIIESADAIMVARGDLALNVDQHQVPLYQKNIIQLCKKAGKPVIVATQMLDSMINNPRPTRAEISDVANAVIDGAEAVMLSGETAFGKYPVKVVETMANIIDQTESSYLFKTPTKKGELIKA
jgi:pyruvate kinase